MQMRVRANTFCHFDKWPERIGRKLVLNEIHFQKKSKRTAAEVASKIDSKR